MHDYQNAVAKDPSTVLKLMCVCLQTVKYASARSVIQHCRPSLQSSGAKVVLLLLSLSFFSGAAVSFNHAAGICAVVE